MIRPAALLMLLALPVAAEPLRPAELPPPDYAGQQYVDSRGCLFLRAGRPGEVLWLPRVTRAGVPLCDNPPSGRAASVADGPAPTGAGWFVAVGSFGRAANVDRALDRLRGLDLPGTRGPASAGLETVLAGPFPTAEEAEAASARLRQGGFPEAVVLRRN